MEPKVTIGVPVYNGEQWLAGTVESVIEQSFSDFSVIICDNASTDGTQNIASELANSDSRIRYHRNTENIGVFRNLDLSFDLSNSKYFKWCLVGDYIRPDFLARAVDTLDSHVDVPLVYSKTRLIGSLANLSGIHDANLALDSENPVSRYREYFLRAGLNSPFHGLVRAEALSKTSLNRPFRGSDQCLIAALLLRGPFYRLDEELLHRRIERSTATVTKSLDELDEFFSVDARKVNQFPTWKFERQRFGDVMRAQLTYKQKFSLLIFLIRALSWQRRKLLGEALSPFRSTFWRR